MNETFLFLLLAAICLLIGAFLGNYFARLKGKTETSKLEERLENAQLQSEKLNERFETALREKEEIRLEKEQINMLLTRRNSEFENLENRNREQKAEVEKLQEKFTKEFENLANKMKECKDFKQVKFISVK